MANSPGDHFESLLSLMARLRGEGGCPWDREQTRESLKPYLLEEAYEVLDAIDGGRPDRLREELGDLLLQIVFHSQLSSEREEFTAGDVVAGLVEKMVRRHPHVFGDSVAGDAREVLVQWERIKADERAKNGGPGSALDGVPRPLPALLRAQRLQEKAGRVGFDWSDSRPALAKVREEIGELEDAVAGGDRSRIGDEMGDLLFSMVNVARLLGVDSEECLRQAADKFTRRFREVEADMRAAGRAVIDATAADLDQAWEVVKAREDAAARGSGAGR